MATVYTSIHTGAEIDESITKVKGQTPGTANANQALILGAGKGIDTIDIVKDGLEIDGIPVTITAEEANKLDGLTASTAELNKLDGVTADTGELNILDGLTATTAELNKLDRSEADGVAEAFKAIVLDANKDLLGKRYDINQSVLGLIASGPFMRFEAGLSPRMTVTDPSDLDFADGDFTIVHCMIIDGTQEVRIGKGAISSADQGYEIRFQTDGDIEVFVSDGSSYFINTSSTPLGQYIAGEVFILALTFDRDGNLTQTYNGIVQGTLDISSDGEKSVSNSSNFYIDRISAGGHSDFFHLYYNLALTLTEIRALSSGLPVSYANSGASMTNLITNGTMEADANWANYNVPSTNERSSVQKHSGTYSRKFTADSANDGIQGDTFTTVTGKKYRHILWVYPDDGTVVTISIRKGDNSGFLYNAETTGLIQDEWNRIVINVTETAGGNGAYFVVQSGGEISGSWYVDDIVGIQVGNVAKFEGVSVFFLQWRDTSNNELHGTIAGALPQSLPEGHEARYTIRGLVEDTTLINMWPAGYSLDGVVAKELAGNIMPSLELALAVDVANVCSAANITSSIYTYLPNATYITNRNILASDLTILVEGGAKPNGTNMETSAAFVNNVGTPTTNERSTEQVHAGTYSRKFIVDGVDEGIKSATYTTVTGYKINYSSIWVYPVGAVTKVTVIIRKGDDSGDLYNNEFTGLTSDEWNEIAVPEQIESAGGAFAYLAITSGTVAAGTYYIDDITAEAWNDAEIDLTFLFRKV